MEEDLGFTDDWDCKKWVHKRSGVRYFLMCNANVYTTNPKFIETAVYSNEAGEIFSRPWSEFIEKFIPEETSDDI